LQPGQWRQFDPSRAPEELGASASGADPRARGVDQYPIEHFIGRGTPSILGQHAHATTDAEPIGGLTDESDALRANVASHDVTHLPDETRHVGCLATWCRTRIEHMVARLRVKRCDDEGRRLILHGEPPLSEPTEPSWVAAVQQQTVRVQACRTACVSTRSEAGGKRVHGGTTVVRPQAQKAPFSECLRGHLRLLVAEQEAQLANRPRHETCTGSHVVIGVSGRWLGWIIRQAPKDSVHESTLARRGEINRSRHRCMRWDPHEQQLIGAETERGARSGAHSPHGPGSSQPDRAVQARDVSECPESKLRRECAISLI
jgi:hypothetical protein